ncbi:MAG: DUF3052 domain-containing protein [Planctomycetota bacterium]
MPSAGYSGTPLWKKLGLKPGMKVALVGAPPGYESRLASRPDGIALGRRWNARAEVIQLFTARRAELRTRLRAFRESCPATSALWVSWPKKSSGVPSEIGEDDIRAEALPLGLVDVKVCAVDEVWSGLRLVHRR